MRDDLTLMSTWHVVMVDEEKFAHWKISTNNMYNSLKTDTKYSHSVSGRPTLKDEERFRNGLVCKTYERSLYERKFMSEPSVHRETCYRISTELSNVNQESSQPSASF